MKTVIVVAAAMLSTLALASAMMSKAEAHVAQADVKWSKPFGPQGPDFGFVNGQMGDKKDASFFVKFPAGADSGWHIHDEDYEAVVLEGTFAEQQQGDPKETLLPAHTYFSQGGKKNHRNGCSKEADCLVFVHFDKGANSIPTTPEGKVVQMPAAPTK